MKIRKIYTFKGGIHPPENKISAGHKTEVLPIPAVVSIPASQHIGAPAVPVVTKGEYVYHGTLIAEEQGGLSLPVHSSVSGTVRDIETRIDNFGRATQYIIIDSDGKYEPDPSLEPYKGKLEDLTPEIAADIMKKCGVCGFGGATFPTYAKLLSAVGKVDRLIINCAECEPYITVNHRLMLEKPDDLIYGVKLLLSVMKLKSGDICIESNKPDAIKLLSEKTKNDKSVNVLVMKTKYPEGDERQLIYAVTGREIPEGKLPADVGCVVFNAETVLQIYRAFFKGFPVTRRRVTVSGNCIKEPKNLFVPIGTSYKELVDYCGGFTSEPDEIISGGPMMGRAECSLDSVVTKGTSAVLFMSDNEKIPDEYRCIHCGRCVSVCQMRLMPNYFAAYAEKGDYAECERYGVMSCVECGACAYICPGNVPITQFNRIAKAKIRMIKAKEKAAAQAKEEKEKENKDNTDNKEKAEK